MAEWCIPFWVTLTLTLTSDLISRFFVSFITGNFPKMCLMLYQYIVGIFHVTVTFLVYISFSMFLRDFNTKGGLCIMIYRHASIFHKIL